MNNTKKLAIIGIIAVGFFGTEAIEPVSAVAGTLTFSDSTFRNIDWNLTTVVQGDKGEVKTGQLPTRGNPGSYRHILNSVNVRNNYTTVWGLHIKTNAIYNPQSVGAITSIDYSEDAINFNFGGGQGQATGLALRQNGHLYFSFSKRLFTPETRWTNKKLKDLKQTDFIRVEDVPTNLTNHPDFSASASPIELGFFRGNSGAGSYLINGGIDNWKVTVNYNDPKSVPEPSSLLSLLAIGAIGLVSKLKHQ